MAALAAVLALTPLLRGSFHADFATKGSESERAATVLAERFAGRSGDTVTVVWKAAAGAQAPRGAGARPPLPRRPRRRGGHRRRGADPRVARRPIASATLELDRRVWDLPGRTGTELIALAEARPATG